MGSGVLDIGTIDKSGKGDLILYLMNSMGQCYYVYNFKDKEPPKYEPQMISGFASAIYTFLTSNIYEMFSISPEENNPYENEILSVSNKRELKFELVAGKKILGLLLYYNLKIENSAVYDALAAVAKYTIASIEKEYKEQLNEGNSKWTKNLEAVIENEIEKLKVEYNASYLKSIISELETRKIRKNEVQKLKKIYEAEQKSREVLEKTYYSYLFEINKEVREKIIEISYLITVQNVINKINKKQKDMWRLFKIPIITEKEFIKKR